VNLFHKIAMVVTLVAVLALATENGQYEWKGGMEDTSQEEDFSDWNDESDVVQDKKAPARLAENRYFNTSVSPFGEENDVEKWKSIYQKRMVAAGQMMGTGCLLFGGGLFFMLMISDWTVLFLGLSSMIAGTQVFLVGLPMLLINAVKYNLMPSSVAYGFSGQSVQVSVLPTVDIANGGGGFKALLQF